MVLFRSVRLIAGCSARSPTNGLFDASRRLGRILVLPHPHADPACVTEPVGGVADAGDLLLEPTSRALERTVTAVKFRRHGELRLARLGGAAGMIGAADLARTP